MVEQNRFWDNGIAVSLGSQQNCCSGRCGFPESYLLTNRPRRAGVRVVVCRRQRDSKPTTTPSTRFRITPYAWKTTARRSGRPHHHIVAEAGRAVRIYELNVPNLTSDRNLFWNAPLPSEWRHDRTSIFKDPLFVDDPSSQRLLHETGSPDVALPEPVFVDAANYNYCGAGPDIGFPVRNYPPATSSGRESDPARTVVTDSVGEWLATFTDGSYTVSLKGPTRISRREPPPILSPTPHLGSRVAQAVRRSGGRGLAEAGVDRLQPGRSPASHAVHRGRPASCWSAQDRRRRDYGPLVNGARQEGSDFNDYLGVPWTSALAWTDRRRTDRQPRLLRFHALVFGYRSKLPLDLTSNGTAIPRGPTRCSTQALAW